MTARCRRIIAVLINFDRLAGWKACPTGSGRTGIGDYSREPLYVMKLARYFATDLRKLTAEEEQP